MKSWLIVILSIMLLNVLPAEGQNPDFKTYSSLNIENSYAYKDGNMYQKDLLLFLDILKQCHPAFAPESDFPFNIDSIANEGYQVVSNYQSVNQLKNYLQAIATLLNDGHTTLFPDINNNLIYPFTFFLDKQNAYLLGINKEYESVLGKQILQINGQPFFEVLNSFRQAISSDNEVYFLDKVNGFMQLYSIWAHNPYCLSDSSLALTFTDGTNISIRPISKQGINIVQQQTQAPSNSPRQNTKQPFQYTILPEKDICYLQFNTCTDQGTLRYQYYMNNPNELSEDLEKKLSQYPRFDNFLSEMFQAIETNKIQTLVIDVRGNSGGNSKLCDILLSWLKPIANIKSESSLIRFSELWAQHYPALATEYKQILADAQLPFEIGKLYDNSFLFSLSNEQESSVFEKIDE
ncbi:MAG: hypothetical protein LBU51_02320, partial [Bacteroidales bacterium]|nr:hypothetical protein [Bacteroidales bacterium]